MDAQSKVHRMLVVDAKLPDLLHQHAVRPGRPVLAYHIGAERSYVMLLSDRAAEPEIWPLTVPARLLDAVQPAKCPDATIGPLHALDAPVAVPVIARTVRRPGCSIAKTYGCWWRIIDGRSAQRTSQRAASSWHGTPRWPRRARSWSSLRKPSCRVPSAPASHSSAPGGSLWCPTGALNGLPLESLVLQAGRALRDVLDELPPIVDAPSLSILAYLAEHRPPRLAIGPRTLLSVARNRSASAGISTQRTSWCWTARPPRRKRCGSTSRGGRSSIWRSAIACSRCRRFTACRSRRATWPC